MSEREYARLMKMASRPVGDDSPAASMRSAAKRPRTEDHDSDEDCGITRTADSTPKEAAPAGLSTPAGAPPTGAVAAVSLAGASSVFRYQRYPFFYPC